MVRETYRDSSAVFEHLANLGELMESLTRVSDMDLEVYGSPSTELVEATAELAPRLYSAFQSL